MALIGEMQYLTIGDSTYEIATGSGGTITGVSVNGTSVATAGVANITSIPLSIVSDAADLKAIEALTGTTGLLKKTANNTWTLDTTSYSTTDTKLQVAAVTSGTTYYPIVGTGTTAATRQYDTTGLVYVGTNGTTSTVGTAKMTLGNSTASGTANNKQGQLVLYGSTAYATTITPAAPSAARTITLPNKTGTVALTSDIPTVPTNVSAFTNDAGYITSYTDTKNTAGSTDTSSKIFLIGATTQAANPQTYSHDTAYVGTNGHLYSASKEVLVGGSNASSTVTITPSTTSVYSMSSTGSVTAGTAPSFTRGTFSGGSLTMTMDTTDTKKLNISFTAATHAADTFNAGTTPSTVTLPGRTQVTGLWNGYTAATAAAQTFTGATS